MSSPNVIRDFSSHLTFRSCIDCDEPVCNCASDEICVKSSRTCTQCPTTSCEPSAPTPTPVSSSSGGSNVGAIAGGVVGGLAFIAILTLLAWWFVIRKRRQEQTEALDHVSVQPENSVRHERGRSMQSIASTVLTRASNVIQIAYIPGVTNRSPPETPGTLVPPVPPIPSTHVSTYSNDQYLFTPRDLRDSRYSNASSDRRSIATSLARSSVATTIYRNDAIVSPMPAQQARAARAAVVSVKTNTSSPSDSLSLRTIETPAVPAITEAQLQRAEKLGPQLSSIVARSVVARPVNVKGSGSKPNVPTVTEEEVEADDTDTAATRLQAKRMTNQKSGFDDSSDDDSDDDEINEKGDLHEAEGHDIQIALSTPTSEGPFSDRHATGTPTVTISSTTASTPSAPSIATEGVSTSRASMDGNGSTHRQRTSIGSSRMLENTISQDATIHRSSSPFDDQHEVK